MFELLLAADFCSSWGDQYLGRVKEGVPTSENFSHFVLPQVPVSCRRPSVITSGYNGKGRLMDDGIVSQSGEYLIRFLRPTSPRTKGWWR